MVIFHSYVSHKPYIAHCDPLWTPDGEKRGGTATTAVEQHLCAGELSSIEGRANSCGDNVLKWFAYALEKNGPHNCCQFSLYLIWYPLVI